MVGATGLCRGSTETTGFVGTEDWGVEDSEVLGPSDNKPKCICHCVSDREALSCSPSHVRVAPAAANSEHCVSQQAANRSVFYATHSVVVMGSFNESLWYFKQTAVCLQPFQG